MIRIRNIGTRLKAQCIIIQSAISDATCPVHRISISDISNAIIHLQIRKNDRTD